MLAVDRVSDVLVRLVELFMDLAHRVCCDVFVLSDDSACIVLCWSDFREWIFVNMRKGILGSFVIQTSTVSFDLKKV